MNFLEELEWRGLLKDVTNKENLQKRMADPITLYCGYDPTADSLHVGHLQQLILLKRYQKEGHHPIALIGGATGMIGDPRPTTERSLLSNEDLQHNIKCLSEQITGILNSDNNPVKIVNNAEWLGEMTMLEFLRDYGKFFSVNTMLAKDTIASRLSTGISFTEFSYTILQAIDYLHLYENHNVELQVGGSDQWGNLVSGTDLIRKVKGHEVEVFGATSYLITKSDGSKFGKSEGENIWLDPKRTDAYTFYQYFVNCSDDDIVDFTRRLSMTTPEEINALEAEFKEAPHKRAMQIALAKELTLLLHGEEGLATAEAMTQALFSGNVQDLTSNQIRSAFADSNTINVSEDQNLVDLLIETKIMPSKREARQMIGQGAISVNGHVIKDLDYVVTKEQAFDKSLTLIRKGKKTYYILNHE
ncbi:MAG TPA: tyrosine--tRNA ligase [Erysipelothrix sp.]|nr:tyrosine--tRNA ligase [Erysipelothrix sp.]